MRFFPGANRHDVPAQSELATERAIDPAIIDVVNKRDWIYSTDPNPFRRCAFLSHFPSLFWDSKIVRAPVHTRKCVSKKNSPMACLADRTADSSFGMRPESAPAMPVSQQNSRLTWHGSVAKSQNRKQWLVISG
jgi:hypothetical protein